MRALFFDTESTDLAASWGSILCASFLELGASAPYTFRRDDYAQRNAIDDSGLCQAIRNELESADLIIGWNSILHDIPLLNARLAAAGMRPCQLAEKHGTWHLDLMFYAGGASMKIGGRKLDTVAKFFSCDNQKTPLDGTTWQLAATGDPEAMRNVVTHCEADVLVLADVFPHLAPHVKKFSISLGEFYHVLDDIPSRIAA